MCQGGSLKKHGNQFSVIFYNANEIICRGRWQSTRNHRNMSSDNGAVSLRFFQNPNEQSLFLSQCFKSTRDISIKRKNLYFYGTLNREANSSSLQKSCNCLILLPGNAGSLHSARFGFYYGVFSRYTQSIKATLQYELLLCL